MANNIIWTPKAKSGLIQTLIFWKEHNQSESYSKKILLEVEKTEQYLSEMPSIGKPITYQGQKEHIRILYILKKFSLFYSVNNNEIIIIDFVSNSLINNQDDEYYQH